MKPGKTFSPRRIAVAFADIHSRNGKTGLQQSRKKPLLIATRELVTHQGGRIPNPWAFSCGNRHAVRRQNDECLVVFDGKVGAFAAVSHGGGFELLNWLSAEARQVED